MFEKFVCTITQENFSEQVEILQRELEKTKTTPKEINRGQLLLEETFFRLKKNSGVENFEATVELKKRFGDVNLQITAKGEEYNPIISLTDYSTEDEDYFSVIILKANRDKMGYSRHSGCNVVSIKVHESGSHQVRNTFIGLFLGIVLGILLKEFVDPFILRLIEVNFIDAFRQMFLNALGMIAGLLIFFSVIAGITGMSKTADVGKIGIKFVGISLTMMLVSVFLALNVGLIFFQEPMPELMSAVSSQVNDVSEIEKFSIRKTIVGIVPGNIVEPLITGNILQVLFLAVFFGVVINQLGEKAAIAMEVIQFMNHFCLGVMRLIVKVIPLIVCLSMMTLIFHTGLAGVITFGKLILVQFLSIPTIFLVSCVAILFFGKISPVPFVKKLLGFIAIPFSTSSSNASLPDTLKVSTRGLGINTQLASFAIPVGIQMNSTGNIFYLTIPTFFMASVYGINWTEELLVTMFFSIFLVALSTPTVPGAGIICMASIFATAGIPMGAVMVILCVDSIIDMLDTVSNVVCDILSTFLLAKSENMVDEKIYLS